MVLARIDLLYWNLTKLYFQNMWKRIWFLFSFLCLCVQMFFSFSKNKKRIINSVLTYSLFCNINGFPIVCMRNKISTEKAHHQLCLLKMFFSPLFMIFLGMIDAWPTARALVVQKKNVFPFLVKRYRVCLAPTE